MAFDDRLDDVHHIGAVVESGEASGPGLRHLPGAHRLIKMPHHILKGVRPALNMAAGVMGAVSDLRPQQAGVVAEPPIRLLAVADPQPLGHFLIPGQRTEAAVNLHRQTVFPPGAHLRDHKAAFAAIVKTQQHRAKVLGIDRPRFICLRLVNGAEGRFAIDRRFTRWPDDRQIRHHLDNPPTGHKLHGIAPVGADVGHRPRRAALRRIDPPVVVGLQQHPVLQIAAVGREDSADLAMADHRRRLLDHSELAIDEADAMHHAGPGGKRHQLPRLLRRHTQRFFGEDVQPGGEDLPVNLGM